MTLAVIDATEDQLLILDNPGLVELGALVVAAEAARDKAMDWAQGAGAPGGGATKSAKGWADAASAYVALAQAWAESNGAPGGGATKSSKGWAALAEGHATAAATSASVALAAGAVYPTAAAGLAAVAEGEYFSVAGTGDIYATLYRKVSGAASLINVYPSLAALKRVGFVPTLVAGAAADNGPALNAALADPAVNIVYVPPGDWSIDEGVIVPTGKELRGTGVGATILRGKSSFKTTVGGATVAGGRGLVHIREGVTAATVCYGGKVRDLTVVCPKVAAPTKINGVWARNAKNFLVENVEVFNAGYAFWAQEYAQYGVFRNITSWNANVHFETTRAFDILFDGMLSGDGDNDNALGVEAVWHTLFESKRITFRNGRHVGRGQPFLVVSDSITAGGVVGDVGDGLMDDIRFENCRAKNTDGKIGFFVSKINAACSVGKVYGTDCELEYIGTSGVPMQIQLGQVFMRGGSLRHKSQDGVMIYAGATVDWVSPRLYVNPNPGASGGFFQGPGLATVDGGVLETTSNLIANSFNNANILTLTPNTRIIRPSRAGKIYTPTIGKPVRHVYTADVEHANAQIFGEPTADDGRTQINLANGGVFRIAMSGKLKKAATGIRTGGVRFDGLGGTLVHGMIRIQTAANTVSVQTLAASGRVATYDPAIDESQFDFEMTVIGNGSNLSITVPLTAAPTIVAAGTTFSAERIA